MKKEQFEEERKVEFLIYLDEININMAYGALSATFIA